MNNKQKFDRAYTRFKELMRDILGNLGISRFKKR